MPVSLTHSIDRPRVDSFLEKHADILGPKIEDAEARYINAVETGRKWAKTELGQKGEFQFSPFHDNLIPELVDQLNEKWGHHQSNLVALVDLANRAFLHSINIFTRHHDALLAVEHAFPASPRPNLIPANIRHNAFDGNPDVLTFELFNFFQNSDGFRIGRIGDLFPDVAKLVAHLFGPFVTYVLIEGEIASFNISKTPSTDERGPDFFGLPIETELAGLKKSSTAKSPADKQTFTVVINDPAGMHIRVASDLIRLAQKYEDTTLHLKPENVEPVRITSKSTLTLLLLGLVCGSKFEFIINGPHAETMRKKIFDLKIDGFPLFLPEGSPVITSESELSTAVESITAPKICGDGAIAAYMRLKEIIKADEQLSKAVSFIDLNAVSQKDAIIFMNQRLMRRGREDLSSFIDYANRIIIFGNRSRVRHYDLAGLIIKVFKNDINNAPRELSSVTLRRHASIENGLEFFFDKEDVGRGIAAMFSRHARPPYETFIELTLDPDHNDDEGGTNNNDSSPPVTNHGGSSIMPPAPTSGTSMSPFMSGGVFARGFNSSLGTLTAPFQPIF